MRQQKDTAEPWADPGPSWQDLQGGERDFADAKRQPAVIRHLRRVGLAVTTCKATPRTALVAGVIAGVGLALTPSNYFPVLAIFWFFIPTVFLVFGMDYIRTQTVSMRLFAAASMRMVTWATAAFATSIVIELLLRVSSHL